MGTTSKKEGNKGWK